MHSPAPNPQLGGLGLVIDLTGYDAPTDFSD
jgi:hypothetical protein